MLVPTVKIGVRTIITRTAGMIGTIGMTVTAWGLDMDKMAIVGSIPVIGIWRNLLDNFRSSNPVR
jgi:hypothetical protein